jgi:hypothetical protein
LLYFPFMAHPPVLVPSILRPSWHARGARSAAVGVGAVVSGALLALWCTQAELPPPLPERGAPVTLAAAAVDPAALQPRADRGNLPMAPVIAEEKLRVVLRSEVNEAWLGGPGTVTEDDALMVVTRPLSDQGAAEVADDVGTRVRLYRADGTVCGGGTVTGALALARLDAGGEVDRGAGPEVVWNAADGANVIAGDLKLDAPCQGAVWARSESLPPPAMATVRKAAGDTRAAAIAALRARPEYRELTDGSGSEKFEVFAIAGESETVLAAQFVAETCVGEQPVLTGFWRVGPGRQLRFLGSWESLKDVLFAADANGDGRIEIMARDDAHGLTQLGRDSGRYDVARTAPVAIRGCRC